MKQLLIILISFLILSYPVIGDSKKGEALYQQDTSSGIVWKGFGDKETRPVYKGHAEDGKTNGIGILIYKDGRKYEGNWKNKIWNGKGKYSFNDGFGYEGE